MRLLLVRAQRDGIRHLLLGLLISTFVYTMLSMHPQDKEQKQLEKLYLSQEPYIAFRKNGWQRIVEQRSYGRVVVLLPESQSEYEGHFIRTIKEIHKANGKYIEITHNEPTKPVAFVLGSALIGTALYLAWSFNKDSSTHE